ncbi:hypothetical protein AYI69_g10652 [Smittium culicis]|uniref:Uncharacterized protein n=1 Tax=Smittium culicis TaxID=133412 RepID=A0A1R1X498_9FUNG|nr:hypothetical protein AYI69_g10652 [Smittium culicis]
MRIFAYLDDILIMGDSIEVYARITRKVESSVDFGSSSSCQPYTPAFLGAQELGSIEIEVMEVDGDTDETRNP